MLNILFSSSICIFFGRILSQNLLFQLNEAQNADDLVCEFYFLRKSSSNKKINVTSCELVCLSRSLLNKKIDVMIYVDRLDGYRIDNLDRQVIRAIARSFGPQIWKIGILNSLLLLELVKFGVFLFICMDV